MRKFVMPTMRFIEGEQGGGTTPPEKPEGGQQKVQTFTQADLDRVVKERVQRERAKYADYDALKAQAAASKTLGDRLADVEKRATDAEASALRSDIAAEFGLSAEDRDMFLTGADRDALTAQAKRLAEREVDRKKRGNVAPKEGGSADNPDSSAHSDMREFARNLFGRTDG